MFIRVKSIKLCRNLLIHLQLQNIDFLQDRVQLVGSAANPCFSSICLWLCMIVWNRRDLVLFNLFKMIRDQLQGMHANAMIFMFFKDLLTFVLD